MQPPTRRVVLGSVAAGLLTSCTAGLKPHAAPRPSAARHLDSVPPTPVPTPTAPVPRLTDVGSLPPNELGSVPVLMFHRVTDPVLGEYDISPPALWDMLLRLHAEGYRPIRMVDLVRRQFPVSPGRTPVVLTFDDSSPGQFHRFDKRGIDPHSGVGVLQAFSAKYPAFRATATFFLNAHPFADPDASSALQTLVRDGFELGNHTLDHVNLGQVSAAEGRREIVALQQLVQSAVGGVRPVSFSLPYGVWPADRSVPISGTVGNESYQHLAVALVGSNPAPSPYSVSWDASAIPRIRASSWNGGQQPYCASWWLDRLSRDPSQRYVVSGQRGTITFPRSLGGNLHPQFHRYARPYST